MQERRALHFQINQSWFWRKEKKEEEKSSTKKKKRKKGVAISLNLLNQISLYEANESNLL